MDANHDILVPKGNDRRTKDARQRLTVYSDDLTELNRDWYLPDLGDHRDRLLERGLDPSSVAAHISAIKTRYRALLIDPETRQCLERLAPNSIDREFFVSQAMAAMYEATSREAGAIDVQRNLDHRRLSIDQLHELRHQPSTWLPQGLRDIVAIDLMSGVGLSETEVCALEVTDFHRTDEGRLMVKVSKTPGGEARVVPIYDQELFGTPCIERDIENLKQATRVSEGKLLRGFFRGGRIMSPRPLTARGIQKMLKDYPIKDEQGGQFTVKALDLRRTYARRLYEAGIDIETLQANLGHKLRQTTLEYIGPPDPPNLLLSDVPF